MRCRCLPLLTTVLLSAAAWGQLDAPLTLTVRGSTVPKVVQAIAEASKVRLSASPVFANESLVLRVTDRQLKDVMDSVAQAVLGKWVEDGDGWRLDRDTDRLAVLRAQARTKRTEAFYQAKEQFLKSHAADRAWDTARIKDLAERERKERQDLMDRLIKDNPDIGSQNVWIGKGSSKTVTPATPALMEALGRLSPSVLADVPPESRVVFSNAPTRMQRPLPFAAAVAINRFTEAHNLLARVVAGGARPPQNVKVSGGLDLDAKPLAAPVTKMLLVLTRPAASDSVLVEVKFADAYGNVVGRAKTTLTPAPPEAPAPPTSFKSDSALSLEGVSLETAKALVASQPAEDSSRNTMVMSTRGGGAAFRITSEGPKFSLPVSPATRAALVDPVTYDPSSTFATDALLQCAEALGKDLVACVPDTALTPLAREALAGSKVPKALSTLVAAGVEVDVRERWLMLKPADPLKTWPKQMDRRAAAALYRSIEGKGYARLREMAVFAQSLGTPSETEGFAMTMLGVVDPNTLEQYQWQLQASPSMMQFLGTLPASVYEGGQPELNLSMSTMSQAQRTYLDRVAFGPGNGFGDYVGEGEFIGVAITSGPEGPGQRGADTLASEPTEAMPNGIPSTGGLNLKFEPMDMVQGTVKGQPGGRFLTAAGLGALQGLESAGRPEFQTNASRFDAFRPAKGLGLTVTRQFVPGFSADTEYSDCWFEAGTLSVPYAQLPDAFRKQVEEQRQRLANGAMRFGRGQRPPD